MWRIPLFELNYDGEEALAVQQVLDGGWITMGPKTKEFEGEFSRAAVDGVKCTAVSSCTAALHISLLSAGIGPGDEVIIPALTFVADANVVTITGADVVLADCVSLDDWNLCPSDVASKITEKTKALICVHFAGYPCAMDELVKLCEDRGIVLIEDVAHAPGGKYKGRALGTFGSFGCFSFFTNKNLSTGEGGMVSTPDPKQYRDVQHLRSHGMSTLTLDRHEGRATTYDVLRPGLNYRIDEMRSAIGLVQLEKLEKAALQREALSQRYRENIASINGVVMPFSSYNPEGCSWHILPTLLDVGIDRDVVMQQMKEAGIQTSIHYPPFSGFTAYSGIAPEQAPIANEICGRELTLPLYPTMSLENVDLVCEALAASILRSTVHGK